MTPAETAAQLRLAADWIEESMPEQPDPYAELKKAHAGGKVIQALGTNGWYDTDPVWSKHGSYRIKPDEIPWIEWHGGECPLNDEEVEEWEVRYSNNGTAIFYMPPSLGAGWIGDDIYKAYRVLKWREKKPKVPLGPEDVTPFTRLHVKVQSPDYRFISWIAPLSVNQDGILVAARSNVVEISWETLKLDYERNDSLETGKWDANAWQACEK